MEALSQIQAVSQIVKSVRDMVVGDKVLEVELKSGLDALKDELEMVSSDVRKVFSAENNQDSKPPVWILQLQELAYEIEDFLEDLGRNPRPSRSLRLFQASMAMDLRREHLSKIQQYKKRVMDIRGGAAAAAAAPPPPRSPSRNGHGDPSSAGDFLVDQQPVGIELPKKLADLLISTGGGHQGLKVISILGCGGSGKTTLARALQEDPSVLQQFHCRAIVEVTSGSEPHDAAKTIIQRALQQLGLVGEGNAGDNLTRQMEILRDFLSDNRYLVIIDGVQEIEVWETISKVFPDNNQGSRIVVTTSIRSVATGCSSAGSYVYTMRGLDPEQSEKLFWSKFGCDHHSPALSRDLKTFFDKCDGLPILLVGTAEFLRRHGADPRRFEDVGAALGNHLAGEDPAFSETRRALTQCCGSLREHRQKMCMLSLSSFPRGYQINRKSLLRRWIAEGLVVREVGREEDMIAHDFMEKLLDLGIVEPVASSGTTYSNSSWSTKARCCQVRSVMLEFLVHRSISWDFMTVIDSESGNILRRSRDSPVRRLSIYGSGNHPDAQEILKSGTKNVRALTIRNSNSKSSNGRLALELQKCKMLRVLDLDGCTWFGNDHFRVICGLLHLKYVSLIRCTEVSKIPRDIQDLHCLETLDLRETHVRYLPMQALLLPRLAHLFGEFELPAQLGDAKSKSAEKLKRFLSDKSKLQTLSGFKIVNDGSFELILRHAKMLKNVKIWCKCESLPIPTHLPPPTKRSSAFRNPICALPLFKRLLRYDRERDPVDLPKSLVDSVLDRCAGSDSLYSLSIDFGSSSLYTKFLVSVLKDPCTLTDIKVSGEMEKLPEPQTLRQLQNVRELHLCNTGLRSEALSALQNMDCLISLKLEDKRQGFWEGNFVVEANGFRSLQLLCFDGPKLPNVEFKEKSMPYLISLRLICTEPAEDLAVTGIAHLPKLNEIILHPRALEAKIQAWEDAAAKHRNRPYVFLKKQPDDDETLQKKKQPDNV